MTNGLMTLTFMIHSRKSTYRVHTWPYFCSQRKSSANYSQNVHMATPFPLEFASLCTVTGLNLVEFQPIVVAPLISFQIRVVGVYAWPDNTETKRLAGVNAWQYQAKCKISPCGSCCRACVCVRNSHSHDWNFSQLLQFSTAADNIQRV